jgi:hypothetical protein
MRQTIIAILTGWVLWIENGSIPDIVNKQTRWKISEAYQSRQECKQEMKKLMDLAKAAAIERGEKVTSRDRDTLWFEKADGNATFAHYYCLPAEVDPRPRS